MPATLMMVAACSHTAAKSNCGPDLYSLTIDGKHEVRLSSCAGNLPPPTPVQAAVGDTVEVRIHGGFSAGYPAPTASNQIAVVVTTETSQFVRYKILAAGETHLSVASAFCEGPRTCVVFDITAHS